VILTSQKLTGGGGAAHGRAAELLEATDDRLLEQLVTFSTHHVRGNTLDLLLTDIPERVMSIADEGRLGASDHAILMANVAVNTGPAPVPTKHSLPDCNRADWPEMRCEMAAFDWHELLRGKNAEQGWNVLKEHVHKLIEKHIPKRRHRNYNKPP
jgi:hypothetical protein